MAAWRLSGCRRRSEPGWRTERTGGFGGSAGGESWEAAGAEVERRADGSRTSRPSPSPTRAGMLPSYAACRRLGLGLAGRRPRPLGPGPRPRGRGTRPPAAAVGLRHRRLWPARRASLFGRRHPLAVVIDVAPLAVALLHGSSSAPSSSTRPSAALAAALSGSSDRTCSKASLGLRAEVALVRPEGQLPASPATSSAASRRRARDTRRGRCDSALDAETHWPPGRVTRPGPTSTTTSPGVLRDDLAARGVRRLQDTPRRRAAAAGKAARRARPDARRFMASSLALPICVLARCGASTRASRCRADD